MNESGLQAKEDLASKLAEDVVLPVLSDAEIAHERANHEAADRLQGIDDGDLGFLALREAYAENVPDPLSMEVWSGLSPPQRDMAILDEAVLAADSVRVRYRSWPTEQVRERIAVERALFMAELGEWLAPIEADERRAAVNAALWDEDKAVAVMLGLRPRPGLNRWAWTHRGYAPELRSIFVILRQLFDPLSGGVLRFPIPPGDFLRWVAPIAEHLDVDFRGLLDDWAAVLPVNLDQGMLGKKQVQRLLGISGTNTLKRWVDEGWFPRPAFDHGNPKWLSSVVEFELRYGNLRRDVGQRGKTRPGPGAQSAGGERPCSSSR